jgi:hypothetical protein
MRRAIGPLISVALLTSCGPCAREKAVPADVPPDTVRATDTGPLERAAEAPLAALRPVEFVVPGWTKAGQRAGAKRGVQRARRAFSEATGGTRYAVTGEGVVVLGGALAANAELPQRITPAGEELGLARSEARALIDDPGGHPALATGEVAVRSAKPNPLQAQAAVRDALKRLAKQAGGSGRILVVRVGRLRLESGTLRVDVTARILADGH